MARISEQTIEQIRSVADITDVIGSYVQLKKRGRNFIGLCPFHGEKTPSFSVSPDKQIYKCFGCGAGGGVINFIMAHEQLEFVESVKFLADRYNVELDIDENSGFSRDLKTQLLDIHQITAQHFYKNLETEEGAPVLQHLLNRGLTKDTIKTFKLGYSIDSYNRVLNGIRERNFTSEAMKHCGIFFENEKGFGDRFRGRIMFSIANTQGKIIAFAGRVFKKDNPAKYVNSPDTPIYNKSQILYGLFKTRKAIQDAKKVIVVEGYLDFLQVYQTGIENIVAVSGTSFTEQHAVLLKRYCNDAIIAYYGDSAGISAAIRAGYVMLSNGLSPHIATIPDGLDPDDWIKNEGPEPFNKAINNATPLLEFHFNNFNGDTETPSGLTEFVNDAVNGISQIKDPIIQELYARSLAELTKISEQSIFQSLKTILDRSRYQQKLKQDAKQNVVTTKIKSSNQQRLEDDLIRLCFTPPHSVRKLIFENMNEQWIQSDSHLALFKKVYIHLSSDETPKESLIMNELTDDFNRRKLSHLTFDLERMEATDNMAKECLIRLETSFLQKRIETLRQQLKNNSNDTEMKLISELDQLQKQKQSLISKYQNA